MKRLILCLLVAWSSSGFAQNEQVPPPTPPLISPTPETGCWLIKISPPQGVTAPNSSVLCTKTGNTKRDVFLTPDGKRTDIWYFKKFAFIKYDNSDAYAAVDSASLAKERGSITGSLVAGPATEFPGFSWLDLKYYKNVVKVGARLCWYYSTKDSKEPQADLEEVAPSHDQGVQAWIDVETKLPIAIKSQGSVYSYEFRTPPGAPLQLPQSHLKALQDQEARLKRRDALERVR